MKILLIILHLVFIEMPDIEVGVIVGVLIEMPDIEAGVIVGM
jgi:hypothetical protein